MNIMAITIENKALRKERALNVSTDRVSEINKKLTENYNKIKEACEAIEKTTRPGGNYTI